MAKRNRNMCVKIAKDVLAQLRMKRYIAHSGTYVEIHTPEGFLEPGFNNLDIDLGKSFKQEFATNKDMTCEVCALGAAFVSLVNIENKCSVKQMCNRVGMFKRLSKYFGDANVSLMESAFECTIMCHNDSINYETLKLAADWGTKYDDDEKRLRAIMLNVIRNKGDFKIPVKMLAKAHSMSQSDAGDDSW